MTTLSERTIHEYERQCTEGELARLQHDEEEHARYLDHFRSLLKKLVPEEALARVTFDDAKVQATIDGLRFAYRPFDSRRIDKRYAGVDLVLECTTCGEKVPTCVNDLSEIGFVLTQVARGEWLHLNCPATRPKEPTRPRSVKLCPWNATGECVEERCALWSAHEECCSLALPGHEISRRWLIEER